MKRTTTLLLALTLSPEPATAKQPPEVVLPLCKKALGSCRALLPLYDARNEEQERTKREYQRQLDEANKRAAKAATSGWGFGDVAVAGIVGFGVGLVAGLLIRK